MGSGSNGAEFFTILSGALVVTGTLVTTGGGGGGGTVDQGNAGSIAQSWYTVITDGSQVLGTGSSAPLWVTGSVVINNSTPVEVTGTINAAPVCGLTTTVTAWGASTTNSTVFAQNNDRLGATFYKEGTGFAFIKLGATATTDSFTVKIGSNGYWELPDSYCGQIDIIFDNNKATSRVLATEIAK